MGATMNPCAMPARLALMLSAMVMYMTPPPARAFLVPTLGTAALKTKVDRTARAQREGSARRWRGSARREKTAGVSMQAGGENEEKNLFDCIREEDVDTLRRYVERGGPVHVADTLGDTSLLVAAQTGNAEVVKILLSAQDADVNYPCFHGGETPLMVACAGGYLGVAECLIKEAGANPNAMNHRGDTALSLAAFWGRLDCLKFLLDLPEINTEIQNIQGNRAGEGMQELMRDDSKDEETVALLRESRRRQGVTRL